jgi:DNA-binding IclR family transcriptional regulator
VSRGGLRLDELAQRVALPASLLAAALEDERDRGRVEQDAAGRWSLTAAGEREVGPLLRAIPLTRGET